MNKKKQIKKNPAEDKKKVSTAKKKQKDQRISVVLKVPVRVNGVIYSAGSKYKVSPELARVLKTLESKKIK